MSDQLKDPNLPAHAIIEVRDDGSALRNDGVELQAANSNPWYVLATVFDEQAEGARWYDYDKELAAKNRRAWNGWACAGLDKADRADRADAVGLKVDDLNPLTKEEWKEITRLFQNRMGEGIKLPDRTENINFSTTYFSKPLIFKKYVVEKDANFGSTTFQGDAYFVLSTFQGDASFRSTTFQGDAYIYTSRFQGSASFVSSRFQGSASFVSSTFQGAAYFGSSTFHGDANLGSSTFHGDANFRSSTFKSATRFDDAKFISSVPQFHGAEMFDDTTFTLPENYRENWPPIRVEGQKKPIKVMPAAQQKRAYNRLRLFMNRSLQFDEEQFFHRQEMRCKKEVASQPVQRGLFGLYEQVSDYGNSVSRPALLLVVIWVWGALAKLRPVGGGNFWPDYHSLIPAMGWSLSNLFPFLGFWRLYSVENMHLNTPLLLIGGAQTICGFALLFLLGLGLRNMFRLR